jgi:hypothetical protein
MKYSVLAAAEVEFLIEYAKNQYAKAFGLHLNSSDWKPYIRVGNPMFYNFLINGIIQFSTRTDISGKKYIQIIQLSNYKRIEPALLLMFLLKVPESDIANFLATFLKYTNCRIKCSCDAFKFWGVSYNLTKLDAIYGPGEMRAPDIRDKERNNLVCKHLWVVLETYEKQIKYFSNGLLPYYKRIFGLVSPTGITRLNEKIGTAGLKQLVINATENIIKTNKDELLNMFDVLTKNKINTLNSIDKSINENPDKANEITNRVIDNINKISDTIKQKSDANNLANSAVSNEEGNSNIIPEE